MPKAIHVTEDNIDYILAYAKALEFDLSHIKDNMLYNREDGWETYLITDGTAKDRNVTFTEFVDADFNRLWKFKQMEDPNHFIPIERITD